MYNFAILENGKASTAVAIQMSPGANAVKTAEGVKAKIEQLSPALPDGMKYSIPYDTAPLLKVSIEKVIMTLLGSYGISFYCHVYLLTQCSLYLDSSYCCTDRIAWHILSHAACWFFD
jgi:multidrug efflux pump subunit AcrB